MFAWIAEWSVFLVCFVLFIATGNAAWLAEE